MTFAGCVKNARGLPVLVSQRANSPEIEEVAAIDDKASRISLRQDEFCYQFATNKGTFFNATKVYQNAFGCSELNARNCASRLLNEPAILARIQKYLRLAGFTVENAQATHAEIMGKGKDEKTRLAAVKLLYEFEGRMVAKTENTNLNVNLSLSSLLKKAKESKGSEKVIDAEVEIEESTDSKERED